MTVKTLKHKKLIIVLSVILAILLALLAAFFVFIKIGEIKLKRSLVKDERIEGSDDFDYSADINYNGKSYYYNKSLVNILFIGVDRKAESPNVLGQADAIYLISLDTDTNHANVFAISRNTITDVDVFDAKGEKYATDKTQLCFSYAYGVDDVQASVNCSNSVSNFLYGIPINNYYTVFMNSVGDVVDAVGGVEVTLTEELDHVFPGKHIGDTVKVTGATAMPYLRYRGEKTNATRLEKQKGFLKGFINSAKNAMSKDWSLPVKLFDRLSKNSITSINSSSVAYLASKAFNANYRIVSIPGKTGFDGQYETFEADDDALYELVVNSFYVVK